MDERSSVYRVLVNHFFRRFFDSDTLQVEGETLTTVVRAVATVAMPGLIVAFFLQNQYPQRTSWGAIEDQYFFVLVSFVVMGAVAIFQWEMLFPDRLDFLVLSPLPVKPRHLLAAKVAALGGFLALFLISSNIFGALILPAISKGDFFRQVYAHVVAVTLAGTFAALFFLALSGVMLCVLNAEGFRAVSPIVQMFSVAALVLAALHYLMYGDSMDLLLGQPLGTARWMPTFWFLGVYEDLLHGGRGSAFAHAMALMAYRATLVAASVVLLTYPAAWARMRKLALEGVPGSHKHKLRFTTRLFQQMTVRPGERAVFAFIGQTVARNNRYQVYLALYSGVGLALATACAVTFRLNRLTPRLSLSDGGLHAMVPLLLFWLILGLRTAFAIPLNLSAGWIFRVTGVSVKECSSAGRSWILLCGIFATCGILVTLRLAGWDARRLLVQALLGFCLSVLLTDGFFLGSPGVPFNKARMPGKTSLPLMLTLYIGVLPLFVYGVAALGVHIEKHLPEILLPIAAAVFFHALALRLRDRPEEIEEEMEGYEGEFQLLGLS